jgi:NRPS condensation-like uncharacterized protein
MGNRLSFTQLQLWFLDQLEPGNAAYNIPAAARLTGQFDVAALRRSLDEIARRHQVLRTTFATQHEQPVPVIAPPRRVPLPVLDLCALPPAKREAEARRLMDEQAHRPFDLAHGPLVRVTLLRLSAGEHVFFLALHHIVADDESVGVFWRELAALYGAFSTARPSPLPELPTHWKRSLPTGSDNSPTRLRRWNYPPTGPGRPFKPFGAPLFLSSCRCL